MGVIRFLIPDAGLPHTASLPGQGYLSCLDGRIPHCRLELNGQELVCLRGISDSAKLNVPWPVPDFGTPTLATTSLREREAPYHLELELARGKISEIRDQAAAWQLAGLALPDLFTSLQMQAFRQFARASAHQGSPQQLSAHCREALRLACQAAAVLADAYVIQRMTSLYASRHHSPGLLGCTADADVLSPETADSFHQAFTAAAIPFNWRELEPAEGAANWEQIDALVRFGAEHRLVCRAGPLVDLGPGGLPDWLTPWKSDVTNLASLVCDFVETAMSRYQGGVRLWEVAARGNSGGALDLSEEHRLALVARILESGRRTDNNAMLFLRVDQPWGEYLRQGRHRLSPLQFVDALARSNLGLSGVVLEIHCGYDPDTYPRDLLAVSRLIDQWSQLGVQLHLDLAAPSSAAADSRATAGMRVVDGVLGQSWSVQTQADWMDQLIPLLLAKPAVSGIFLSHYSDRLPHRFPHAGLLQADGHPKPLLGVFRKQLCCDLS